MARVLVVEDNPEVGSLLQDLLERAGYGVDRAPHGQAALPLLERTSPDAVITDLKMPVMDGLELVEAIRKDHPAVPVILTTGLGSEEIAVEALQKGAASYVPKSKLALEILPTLRNVLSIATAQKQKQLLLDYLVATETEFHLTTDVELVTPLVGHVDEMLQRTKFCDEATRIRLGIALHEALVNAIVHGNLEVTSDLRESESGEFGRLVSDRAASEPYRSRKVHVHVRIDRDEARFVIRDEGPGFDQSRLWDPTDPAHIDRVSGRGLFLIRTFLDVVHHNSRGNEITLIKRREPGTGQPE